MPICRRCERRIWFLEADLLGGPCARCRDKHFSAEEKATKERNAARRAAFEQSDALRRAWLGGRRGALLGAFGLVAVGVSLLALAGGPGASRYPFRGLSPAWIVISLGAVAAAGFVGWWLSSWWVGIACLVGLGALAGTLVGAYQGLRGRWVLFA